MVAESVLAELRRKGHEAMLFFPDAQVSAPGKDHYYSQPDLYRIWRFPIERGRHRLESFPLMIPDPNPRTSGTPLTFRDLSDDLLAFYFEELRSELRRLVEEFRPDIVESQHVWTMGYTLHELGLPYVLTAHHSDQMGYRYDSRMQRYADHAAAGARRIFAISQFVERDVRELYPDIPPAKVVVIENGYNQGIFYPNQVDRSEVLKGLGIDTSIDTSDDFPIVSFSGKISRTKGIDVLLRANRLLQRECKALVIIAGTGRLEDEFTEDERADFHLKNVHFVGQQPQAVLAGLHNAAACSVIPSRTEGFGIAALEAMGCGTPMVATRSGGPETFAVGATVEVENVEELAAALVKLLRLEPDAARALRQKALERARQYSWGRIVDLRLECYRQALSPAQPAKNAESH